MGNTRNKWTDEEIKILKDMYYSGHTYEEISQHVNHSISSINSKSTELHLDNGTNKHSINYKAEYQDRDWCFEKYITLGMSYDEISEKYGYSRRVIQKWCSEKFGLNKLTFRKYKKLNNIQRDLVTFSLLGDGHISKRDGTFIVTHAENQKDYLYWKYNLLRDICGNEPYMIPAEKCSYNGKSYCTNQNQFKFATRELDDLCIIRDMPRINIIHQINEFGLSVHLLDDASYNSKCWELCLAEYTDYEKNEYINICKERFGLYCHLLKDTRYVLFDVKSSNKINDIILRNIPNDLDIIQYKIINRKGIE